MYHLTSNTPRSAVRANGGAKLTLIHAGQSEIILGHEDIERLLVELVLFSSLSKKLVCRVAYISRGR